MRVLLLLLVVAACSRSSATKHATTRIVSLTPSTTEAVFAIGAGPMLVGRSRYCNYPPEVTKLPPVGGFVDPSFEAILALEPSLVVGARGPAGSAIATRLEAHGIQTYFPETESFAGIDAMILGLGERTRRSDAARATVEALHGRIQAIESSVAGLPRTRVLVVFGLAPVSVAGPGSFVDEMIRRAGGANVVAEGGAYPTLGLERVLALDPDLIVNAAMWEERATDRLHKDAPGWGNVRAVAKEHVAVITDEAMLRPGPRIAEGLRLLARAMHP
jgi:iron complex transport system substrate-binding protein